MYEHGEEEGEANDFEVFDNETSSDWSGSGVEIPKSEIESDTTPYKLNDE